MNDPLNTFSTSLGQITVAQAIPSDLEQILVILNEACSWLTAKGIDQWRLGRFSPERGMEAIGRGEVYVARLGNKLIGTFRLQWSDEVIWNKRPGSVGYVHVLAVARAYAGNQIGAGLLRWASGQVAVRGRQFLRLDCMAANPGLRQYYQGMGFTFVSEAYQNGWKLALFEREVGSIRGTDPATNP